MKFEQLLTHQSPLIRCFVKGLIESNIIPEKVKLLQFVANSQRGRRWDYEQLSFLYPEGWKILLEISLDPPGIVIGHKDDWLFEFGANPEDRCWNGAISQYFKKHTPEQIATYYLAEVTDYLFKGEKDARRITRKT